MFRCALTEYIVFIHSMHIAYKYIRLGMCKTRARRCETQDTPSQTEHAFYAIQTTDLHGKSIHAQHTHIQ